MTNMTTYEVFGAPTIDNRIPHAFISHEGDIRSFIAWIIQNEGWVIEPLEFEAFKVVRIKRVIHE